MITTFLDCFLAHRTSLKQDQTRGEAGPDRQHPLHSSWLGWQLTSSPVIPATMPLLSPTCATITSWPVFTSLFPSDCMFLEQQVCVLSTFIKLVYIVGAQDGKRIKERPSPWVRDPEHSCICLSAQLHQAASKAHHCHTTLGGMENEKGYQPLSSPASPAIAASWKKQRLREGESYELSAQEKVTFSYSPSHPHFTALLHPQHHSSPLYLLPTPSNNIGHLPLIWVSLF